MKQPRQGKAQQKLQQLASSSQRLGAGKQGRPAKQWEPSWPPAAPVASDTSTAVGTWVVSWALGVRWAPLSRLTGTDNSPKQVPSEWHNLLPLRLAPVMVGPVEPRRKARLL